MKKFATLTAATAIALSSTAAFAASTALESDAYWSAPGAMKSGVYELMVDPDTKSVRTDEDFTARWATASDEDKANFGAACDTWAQDKVLFTDDVAAKCNMAVSTGEVTNASSEASTDTSAEAAMDASTDVGTSADTSAEASAGVIAEVPAAGSVAVDTNVGAGVKIGG